jgi:hypothetical protein
MTSTETGTQFGRTRTLFVDFSKPKIRTMPTAANRLVGNPRKNSLQARINAALHNLPVGSMTEAKFAGDGRNLRARITLFKKKNPTYRVTTRLLEEGVLGIWRLPDAPVTH